MAGLSQRRGRGFISQLLFSVLLLSLIFMRIALVSKGIMWPFSLLKNVRNYASQCIREIYGCNEPQMVQSPSHDAMNSILLVQNGSRKTSAIILWYSVCT